MQQLRLIKTIITLILCIIFFNASSQDSNVIFEKLTNKDGLSQGTINTIFQDSKGFMWFGTNDGLNKYDGYNFKTLFHSHSDTNSISNNHIIAITEDLEGNIWIGTNGGGLNRYDISTDCFYAYKHDKNNLSTISDNKITALFYEAPGILWIGTEKHGLDKLDLKTQKFTHYKHNPDEKSSLSENNIRAIIADKNGNLWIGTNSKGLNLFNKTTETFTRFLHDPDNPKSLSSNNITSFAIGKEGNLWIATGEASFNKLNISNNEITRFGNFLHEPSDNQYNYILSIAADKNGNIWFGTNDVGVFKYNILNQTYTYYYHSPNNSNSISYNGILSLYTDNSNTIWIGTNGKGINYLSPASKKFRNFVHIPNIKNTLSFPSVRAIFIDDDSILWVSGYGGLNRFDKKTNKVDSYLDGGIYSLCQDTEDPDIIWVGTEGVGLFKFSKSKEKFTKSYKSSYKYSSDSLYGSNVYKMVPDKNRIIWIGTDAGLNKFNKNNETFTIFSHDPDNPKSINHGYVKTILKDRNGIIWIGTHLGGISYFDGENNEFTRFIHNPDDTNSLSSNSVNSIYEDRFGNIWVSTIGGLNKFDRNKKIFKHYTTAHGLPNDVVYATLDDNDGNIWISTNQGISKFNPKENKFTNYDADYGLQGNEFNTGAYFKSKDGEIYFGGINGFNSFYPDQIIDNPHLPPVVFTSFKKYNKKVQLSPDISEAKEIVLDYRDVIFSFEFSALNYYKTDKNLYAYKLEGLEGFDKAWIHLGTKNNIDFTGLKPGDYILRIKASNNDGIWNEEGLSLKIKIIPPFWRTWWFITSVITIIIALIILVYLLRIKNIRKQQEKLKILVDEKTKHLKEANINLSNEINERKKIELKLRDVNNTKDKFFSIISHDLKNPFSALMGFSEVLYDEYDNFSNNERKDIIKNINISSESLFKLSDNLLKWARIQTGEINWNPDHINLDLLVENAISLLKTQAINKKISITSDIPKFTKVYADINMADTVVRNLLSNAIKFTPNGGKVKIASKDIGKYIEVSITDTGLGINKENISKLFNITEKFATEGTNNELGSGLGLILCRGFVEKNNGKIWVESKEGEGSKFIFTLPKNPS